MVHNLRRTTAPLASRPERRDELRRSDEHWVLGHDWRDNLAGAWTTVVKGVEPVAATIRIERQAKAEKIEEYRALVGEKLHDHLIDPGERDALNGKRDKLGLSHEEAAEIERAYRATQQELLDAIAKCRKTLGTYLKQGIYPFTAEQREQLKSRQKDLALTDEHILGVEDGAVAEWNDDTLRAEREETDRAARLRSWRSRSPWRRISPGL